jgi:hypothetical protein
MNSRSSVCPAYGYCRVRYLGLARDDVQLQAMCAAINLRRTIALGLAWPGLAWGKSVQCGAGRATRSAKDELSTALPHRPAFGSARNSFSRSRPTYIALSRKGLIIAADIRSAGVNHRSHEGGYHRFIYYNLQPSMEAGHSRAGR